MIRKLLTSAAATALIAGAANSLELENELTDMVDPRLPQPIAAQIDFAGGDADGDVTIGFAPETGILPPDNLVFFVTVTGAEFDSAVDGTAISGTGSGTTIEAIISTGGAKGGTEVSFSVDGADGCAEETAGSSADATCFITLPLELDGTTATISVGIETDAGVPIDDTSSTDQETLAVFTIADAFDIDIVPDATATTADLNADDDPFTAFTSGSDTELGTVAFAVNTVNGVTVASDVDGTAVNATLTTGGDLDTGDDGLIALIVTGNLDAFEDGNTPAGDVLLGATCGSADPFTSVSSATDTATSLFQLGVGAPEAVCVQPDGVTPIPASSYNATVSITPADGSNLSEAQVASGSLQPIVRNGTTIVFPWTQSGTQGAATGTTSVFRLGNLDNDDAGPVFVEVANTTESGFMNPGIVQLADGIDADGEFVINSSTLESELGNYGRGDIIFTIEANPDTLTGRQFVVRGDVIQQVTGGNVLQDQ